MTEPSPFMAQNEIVYPPVLATSQYNSINLLLVAYAYKIIYRKDKKDFIYKNQDSLGLLLIYLSLAFLCHSSKPDFPRLALRTTTQFREQGR